MCETSWAIFNRTKIGQITNNIEKKCFCKNSGIAPIKKTPASKIYTKKFINNDLITLVARGRGSVKVTPSVFLNSSKTVKDAILRLPHKKLTENPQIFKKKI